MAKTYSPSEIEQFTKIFEQCPSQEKRLIILEHFMKDIGHEFSQIMLAFSFCSIIGDLFNLLFAKLLELAVADKSREMVLAAAGSAMSLLTIDFAYSDDRAVSLDTALTMIRQNIIKNIINAIAVSAPGSFEDMTLQAYILAQWDSITKTELHQIANHCRMTGRLIWAQALETLGETNA